MKYFYFTLRVISYRQRLRSDLRMISEGGEEKSRRGWRTATSSRGTDQAEIAEVARVLEDNATFVEEPVVSFVKDTTTMIFFRTCDTFWEIMCDFLCRMISRSCNAFREKDVWYCEVESRWTEDTQNTESYWIWYIILVSVLSTVKPFISNTVRLS